MKELKFKTNLNCGNCVAKVQPAFDAEEGILEWNVDTENPDKILTVNANEELEEEDIIVMVRKKGFQAEVLK
ncbi:copper chaperone [Cruoricaptor ignavus]|uniref:Copper chaperone n=1 Tax=Cruoricaptor ignavus TaxID=1118202 RepID=A0A1M6D0M9_9FLAO|nr:heavy metal-associated domain-containing protein [Cruoricaptor ignavus]SHI66769.1 copper chaperone [Cruoricaptor ignavus]